MMHEREKSDTAVVVVKPTNNARATAAEPAEPTGARAALQCVPRNLPARPTPPFRDRQDARRNDRA
jgi:hypothetical protein